MIQRKPDMVFAVLWLARYVAMFTTLIMGSPLGVLIASASFFPVEGVAIARNTGLRDTLSEIWTFTLRFLAKHAVELKPFTGWNWLSVIFATFEAGVVVYLFDHYVPSFGLYADVMAVGLAALLHAHWVRPDIVG